MDAQTSRDERDGEQREHDEEAPFHPLARRERERDGEQRRRQAKAA
jgi:hypothetical protein